MSKFTLEYWPDEDGYVGRLKEVPGVVSQGNTVAELRENIKDAYHLLMSDAPKTQRHVKTSTILLAVA
ncbi:MAG: type II toxin-antitoxin system HicB family antitoxin [Elusimicrobiota bacterium]|nr:type II toxin-antitoxin system HicB family antitoxin [Elusimicrobiota bacterium]